MVHAVVAGATLTVRPPLDPVVSGNRSLDEFAEAGTDEQAGGSEATPDGSPDAGAPPAAAETSDAPTSVDLSTEAGGSAPDAEAGTAEADDVTTDDEAAAEDDAPSDDGAIDPPASSYVWNPGGAPCDACGTAVEERWRDGDGLVCAGCKEW